MKSLALLIVATMQACASSGVTRQGMRWAGRPQSDAGRIERAVDLTAHAFWSTTRLDVDPGWAGDLRVIFMNDRPDCSDTPGGSVSRTCHGVLRGRYMHLKNEVCIAHTSLAHELIHQFALYTIGNYNANHDDTRLWIVANIGTDKDDSAEARAIAAMMWEGYCDD